MVILPILMTSGIFQNKNLGLHKKSQSTTSINWFGLLKRKDQMNVCIKVWDS